MKQTSTLFIKLFLLVALLTGAKAYAGNVPAGSFDVCTIHNTFYLHVSGWAKDDDAPSTSIDVRVDICTDNGYTEVYKSVTLPADKYRQDVGQHAFDEYIEIDAPNTYWVCVTALDATGDNDRVLPIPVASVSNGNNAQPIAMTGWTEVDLSDKWTTGIYKVTQDITIDYVYVLGDVTLFLSEGTTLTVNSSIFVNEGNWLTIDGTGSLVAFGDDSGPSPAIGAKDLDDYNWNGPGDPPPVSSCGEIVINNGHITATGAHNCPAIGGNYFNKNNTACKITINGGVVHATGGSGAPAIGGGIADNNYHYYMNSTLTEYTGTLLETDGMPGTVVINGGQVTAIADPTVYAIGRGPYATGSIGSVTLGWTNPTDFIYATRLDTELLSIAEGKTFIIDKTGNQVNASNVSTLGNFSNGTLWPNVLTLGSATVSGILPAYTRRAEPFLPTYTVTDAFGTVLTEGTDFTAALTSGGEAVAQLNAVGSYTLTLTGTGQYIGTRTFDIEVQDIVAPPLVTSPDGISERNAIRQTDYTENSATLEWSDLNADVTTWKLEYSKNFRFDEAYAPVQELTVTGTPRVTITGLDPETSYYARVKAVHHGVESDWGGVWYYNDQGQNTGNGSTRFETTANKTWAGSGKIETSHEIPTDMFLPYYYILGENFPCDQLITQQIYTADEIGRAGFINSLSFRTELPRGGYRKAEYYINENGLEWYEGYMNIYPEHPLQVYLVQTDKVSFSDAEDMISYTDADLVWSGQLTEAPDSWNTITFSTPFPYDGRHNLAVIIYSVNSGSENVRGWCGFHNYFTDKPQALYSRPDAGINSLILTGPINSSTGNPIKNHIRFGITSLDLADQTANGITISSNGGETTMVTLSDRTLYRDGDWNTLCLPFNMGDATAAEGHHFDGTELEGATVMQLNPANSSLSNDGTLTLNFTDAASIEAGKPYIVKWNPANYAPNVPNHYIITSEADWNAFASNPNADAVLATDISVSTMVGGFSGTFDGNGHTITFNCGSAESPYTGMNCALFSTINGATIKNLHVAGNIYTSSNGYGSYAGGLVGQATGNCTIANCHVSTNITGKLDGYSIAPASYNGGIIGRVGYYNISGNVSITDCLFDGQLNGTGRGIANCKGFVGCLFEYDDNYYINTASVTITRSLFAPSANPTVLTDFAATFATGDGSTYSATTADATITDCYYTQTLGMPQGTDASSMSAAQIAAALGSNWTVSDGKAVPALTPNGSYLECTAPTFGPYQIVGAAPAAVTFDEGRCSFQGTYEPFNDRTGLLLDKRNTSGNGVFQAGIDLKGYVVNGWFTDAARTVPATYIPFDENTGQVTLYLNTTEAVKRTVNAATNWDDPTLPIDGWNFVSSPVTGSIAPSAVTNLFPVVENVPNAASANYDLYRLNAGTTMWENYKSHTDGFGLDNGLGYLYASKDKTTLVFTAGNSNFNTDNSKTIYNLPKGFSLVGNPFKVNAYINKSYYIMDETGTYVVPTMVEASTPIAPCTGVVVEVTDSDVTSGTNGVTFSTSLPSQSTGDNGHLEIALTQTVAFGETPNSRGDRPSASSRTLSLDKAIVSFNEGARLGKFHFGEQNGNIYIPQGGKEYAIVNSTGQGEIPINFKANKNGVYTLTVSETLHSSLSTLHLIDNLTGTNVDLLQTPSYTFEGKTDDYASRFKLVFVSNDAELDNEMFAFVSDGQIVIVGDGLVQVIDLLGHTLVSKDNAHRIPTAGMSPGVYVLRLINGEKTKTQKIVIK